MTTIAQAWTDATRQHDAHMYDYALHNIAAALEEMDENRSIAEPDSDVDYDGFPVDQPREWLADHRRDYRKHES
jgi:hypothetical protein